MNIIIKAAILAAKAHHGMTRADGETPYLMHPLKVAAMLPASTPDYVVAAAILHDVVEDTDFTLDDIRTMFGDNVAVLVDELTVMPDTPNRRAFAIAKVPTLSEWATIIKTHDVLHNLADLEKADWTDEKKATYKKYLMDMSVALAKHLDGFSKAGF